MDKPLLLRYMDQMLEALGARYAEVGTQTDMPIALGLQSPVPAVIDSQGYWFYALIQIFQDANRLVGQSQHVSYNDAHGRRVLFR